MLQASSVEEFSRFLQANGAARLPEIQIVLGSGFGSALEGAASAWSCRDELPFERVRGLAASTVPDHHGKYRIYEHTSSGRRVVFQLGRLHGYEGHSARAAVAPVMVGRLAGIRRFLLTNAAGGLVADQKLGDVMLLRDHVNLTGQNPLTGPNPVSTDGKPLGPRFPDLSTLYDPEWRKTLRAELASSGVRVHEGVYIGVQGPSFETPAEITLFSHWGMHAIGMSTVWEAIALGHSGARLAALSLISNAAAGLGDGAPLDHEKILETCRASARLILRGIFSWIEKELGIV